MSRFNLPLLATLCASLLAGCSTAPRAEAGDLLDVQILSRATGLPLTVYTQRGKRYVVGTPGEGYAIRLINRSGGRVLGVLSVDGVNAITGETAATSQSGYVLGPYQSAEITGWRKSMEDVARFYFTPLPDSYAALTGRPDNVGVIGVAAYAEYQAPPPLAAAPAWRADNVTREAEQPASAAAEGAAGDRAKAQGRIGTGHGERETAPTRYTEFRRASDQPQQISRIHYDSRARLISQGVIPAPRVWEAQPQPHPFPGGFVPDPRG